MKYVLPSSDQNRLLEAILVAQEYANQQNDADIVGIAFLGAITRGYFDVDSDIDITVFKKDFKAKITSDTREFRGFQLHEFIVDIDNEKSSHWELGKRWAFSNCQIYWEKNDQITSLLNDKVPMKEEERRWLALSGITLSEWYCNRLTELWIKRGDIISAHYMIAEGLNHFFNAIFAINNELPPDHKWRFYCSKQLANIPSAYEECMVETMEIRNMDLSDLSRRKKAFMDIWNQFLPSIENYLGMTYSEFKDTV